MRLGISLSLARVAPAVATVTAAARGAIVAARADHYFDTFDATDGATTLSNRNGTGTATLVGGLTVQSGAATLDNVNDYIQLPASCTPTFTNTTGEDTRVILWRYDTAKTQVDALLSTDAVNVYDGVTLQENGAGTLQGRIGSVVRNAGSAPVGATRFLAATVVDDGLFWAHLSNVGTTPPASITAQTVAHTAPRLGSRAYGLGAPAADDFYAYLDFAEPLSDDDLSDLYAYLESLR